MKTNIREYSFSGQDAPPDAAHIVTNKNGRLVISALGDNAYPVYIDLIDVLEYVRGNMSKVWSDAVTGAENGMITLHQTIDCTIPKGYEARQNEDGSITMRRKND